MKKFLSTITMFVVLLVGAATNGYAQSKGPIIKGNVYGGGENAKVMGDNLAEGESTTSVTINNGNVKGDVFGAGKGVTVSETPATGTDKDGNTINHLKYDQIATVNGNTKVQIDSTTVEPIKKGTVWGNIYGGAENAIVNGNANVLIAGGKFASDVFGGGKGDVTGDKITAANVKKNTHVEVTAGEIVWNKKLGSDGDLEDAEFFDDVSKKFLKDHNIYAGGHIACTVGTWNAAGTQLTDKNTGTSSLTMTRGLIGSDLLSSNEWKEAFAQHEDPHFYAFGGGYGIYTKAHKSDVNICLPMVDEEGASGGDEQLVRPQWRAPGNKTNLDLDIITDNYGVAWTTVLGILGGGYNGHVEKTNVLVGDATYAHRVYGGGLGSYEGWEQASADSKTPNTEVAGYVGTTGKLPLTTAPAADLQTTHVTLAGGHIHGDVFGGGAGVAPRKLDGSTFTDFTEIARVKGNTLVETTSYETYLTSKGTKDAVLASHPNKTANTDHDESKKAAYPLYQRAQIFGNVYGGGDVANVSGNTNVSLFGGDVFGYTFGAGLGRLTTEASDYADIGNVTLDAKVTLSDLAWPGTSAAKETHYPITAWDDIYGGGRNGVTNGNTNVTINGGLVGDNIFGGGLGNVDGTDVTSADVKGNTTVNVNGGSYQWREIADINGNKKQFIDNETITQSELLSRMGFEAKLEPVNDFFNYRTASYTRDHSIYGGGNVACNVGTYSTNDKTTKATSGGTATVNMNHGLFADKDIKFTDEDFNIATLCRYLACNNSENTQFGVFGGGYGANTKVSETEVNLNMGQSTADIALWAEYFGKIQTWYKGLSEEVKKSLYGGSSGENAYNRYFTARMAKSINVPSHTVLTAAGGGLAGYVAGDTKVTMTGHSGALRIFGGGIGMKPDDLETLNPTTAADLTYGQVGGDATVKVNAGVVVQNVYGGGAGVESQLKEDDSYLDFPGMAHVLGKTDVSVGGYSPGTVVFGKVYGGGDVANVGIETGKTGATEVSEAQVVAAATGTTAFTDPQTKVTIDGGCVFQQVFAGGSGRTKNVCYDYTQLGAVYGNTQLIINNSAYTAEQAAAANLAGTLVDGWTNKIEGDINEPWLWDIVYGGGQNGTVFGNTDVQILGGNLGYDIFGGGWGNKTASAVLGVDDITSADVTQNTNVRIKGGKWCLSQSWNGIERHWEPANGGGAYSSQYDPDAKKFNINHNVYGGGNVACAVNGSGGAYVYVKKGMLVDNASLGHTYSGSLFKQDEWAEIYKKHASPHFSVFGAGFGADTKVNNTFVKVDMGTDSPKIAPSASSVAAKDPSAKFETLQSLMDVIGGGYEGKVNNTCHVDIDGYTFMRNAFGGAYYATVGNTDVKIRRANMDNVYGGGMMGDVKTNVNVTIGSEANDDINVDAETALSWNKNLIINEDVYGANDVAGYVGAVGTDDGSVTPTPDSEGVKLKLNGGHIYGSVYGGGNGNYLYQIDDNVAQVTVVDDYDITSELKGTIYKVPLRSGDFPALSAMSSQQKMVNVNSYRPSAMKVDIDFKGNSTADRLRVDGNIFGGGNSATIRDYDGIGVGEDAKVHMNVGSHILLGGVFLGSDGDALFDGKYAIMDNFPIVNDLTLYENIDWTTTENATIPTKLLPTEIEKRPEIYKNNIDLYFMPVEMAIMPEVTWGKGQQNNSVEVAENSALYETVPETADGLVDAEIGTFCCGGNRGNMDTKTNFHINFPMGLTITDKIVGGCNNANYSYRIPGTHNPVDDSWETMDHTGGFLLGSHGVGKDHQPQIHLTLRNRFKIATETVVDPVTNVAKTTYPEKCNVFGGCYRRGTVRGDILIDVFSNMLMSRVDNSGNYVGLDSIALRRATDDEITVCSVYGAGYGNETWVRGDTEVRLGDDTQDTKSTYTGTRYYSIAEGGSSCNYIFGGGRNGNVIGNTNVHILNGRVGGCAVGASYAGYLYGSAQTMVGFPEQYYRAKVSRSYELLRADEDPDHADYKDDNGNLLIKKKVYYTKGDLVTATVYNSIKEKIVEKLREANSTMTKAAAEAQAKTELQNYFDEEHSIPTDNDWSKINIQIDKAIYGGGYALATGSGSYTVLKYTGERKFLEDDIKNIYQFSTSGDAQNDSKVADFTKYGGNTFVMVGDISGEYDEVAKTEDAGYSPVDNGHKDGTEHNRDHITLSSSQLRRVDLKVGDDLFGLFKELTNKEAYPTKYGVDGWDDPNYPARVEEGKQLSGLYMKITTELIYLPEDRTNGSLFFEFTGEGGIYGDGRLSLSEGFRVCDAMGYGYNGTTPKAPKLMNCIHRFDIARFKDCCISLLGDRDYTSAEGSEANAMSYSMARVEEVLMESSIPQDKDFLSTEKKHSRNYVGLSNAQFDLAAVKSNDLFSADPDAALYHNKSGQVITADGNMLIEGTDAPGSTAKHFKKMMSYYQVKKWYLNDYNVESTLGNSDYYDNAAAQVRNEMQFQLRNSATARNMFGIFSGYALNVHSTHYNDLKLPEYYYGPVIGVFEVDLIGTRAGEAGGYAYAQNIHKENAKNNTNGEDLMVQYEGDTESHTVHSFLETSGNFVFPATDVRKVVDNCTPTAYNRVGRDAAEGHYWYVTGFKYYYNAMITGYTYDGKTKYFETDNSAKRLVLTGTKKGQTVDLEYFHWLPRHSIEYYKDYEEYNAAHPDAQKTEDEFAAMPDNEKVVVNRQDVCDIEKKYLTTKYNAGSDATLEQDKAEWQHVIEMDDRKDNPFYNLSLSLSEYGNYTEGTTENPVPYISLMPQDKWTMSDDTNPEDQYKIYEPQSEHLTNTVTKTDPLLGIRLTDCVDNNGKENGVSYFSKYLDDPCVAKIVLKTPAQNDKGEDIWSNYTEVPKQKIDSDNRSGADYKNDPYYMLDANGSYYIITLGEAQTYANQGVNVFEVAKPVYKPLTDKAYDEKIKYYELSGTTYTEVNLTKEQFNGLSDDDKAHTYFFLETDGAHREFYEYDITLTIKYIKGPSYEGRIDIKNCALPGEMIRLSHENLKIESDVVSLPHNGSFWTIGPGKKVWNDELDHSQGYHWELVDPMGAKPRESVDATGKPITYYYTDPDTRNLYYPYNPNVTDPKDKFLKKAVSPIMQSGMYHDAASTEMVDYFLPAYYFMNGYVAQYSFTVNGINEVFTTTIHPEDTLLVHNYHRMAKALAEVDTKEDIKLSRAMVEHNNVPDSRELIDLSPLMEGSESYIHAQHHNAKEEEYYATFQTEWPNTHKRPRVYIQNVDDFQAFAQYLGRTTATSEEFLIREAVAEADDHTYPAYEAVKGTNVKREATDYGRDVEFFLMNDIDLTGQSWSAVNFNGILHGNGHVIKGLKNNESLFATLGDDVHIYNLGLPKGKIATTKNEAIYHCSYTYDTGEKDANNNAIHHVYRMDGTDYTGYTDENDWRTGRVAYDLNEFYLAERLDRHKDDDDDHLHTGYVEGLFADGEYRFSRYSSNVDASEYLRSKTDPNYAWNMVQSIIDDPSSVSNHYYSYDAATHKLSHKVDEPRAYYENEGEPAVAVLKEYRPLIDEAKVNSAVELTAKKNDYIFFGQTVNDASYTNAPGTVGSNLPDVVSASSRTTAQGAVGSYEGVTHNVDDQTNRVWRAYGFYHSKEDDAFHFNKAAWALHPDLTAIDFTGLHDKASFFTPNPDRHKWAAGMKAAEAGTNAAIFYPKMMDMPEKLTSFNVGNQDYVTKNLLVYTDAKATAPATDQSATAVAANNRVNYEESTAEGNILGHWIQRLGAADANGNVFAGKYLHLVERATGTPGAGETDGYSNDFNAPIAFSVTERAWYERQPMGYRNNHSDANHHAYRMWEGISLPFTATKVTAILQSGSTGEANGEISHFYGINDNSNGILYHELYHEYWLRGLTNVDDNVDAGYDATFARPGETSAGGLFAPMSTDATPKPLQEKASESNPFVYKNDYFAKLIDYSFGEGYGDWYAQAATTGQQLKDYIYLTKEVPYLVAFPGNDYYEFSMEGDVMYDVNSDLSGYDSHRKSGNAQHAVFEALKVNDTPAANVLVSDDQLRTTTANGYDHIGLFMEKADAAYTLDAATGEKFTTSGTGTVVPFRTYMQQHGNPVKGDYVTRSTIYIVDGGIEGVEPNDDDYENDDIDNTASLTFKVDGLKVTVENGYEEDKQLTVYLAGGQLVMRHTAPSGQSTFRLPKSGLYIIGGKKVLTRE